MSAYKLLTDASTLMVVWFVILMSAPILWMCNIWMAFCDERP